MQLPLLKWPDVIFLICRNLYHTGYAPIGKSTRKWEHLIKIQEISLRKRKKGLPIACPTYLRYPWYVHHLTQPSHRSLVWWHHGSSHCGAFGTSEGRGWATFQVATMALLAEEGANAPASKVMLRWYEDATSITRDAEAACTVSVIFIITPIVIPSCSSF